MIFLRKRSYIVFQTLNILLAVFLLSCGLEEYYYLPQIPQGNITTTGSTDAVIYIPPISQYYATNYSIFYRVYISDFNADAGAGIISSTQRNQVSSALASDFNALESFTNPANSTSVTTVNTFRNRNYFEIEFEDTSINSLLSTNGGTLSIMFPTRPGDIPVVSLNNGPLIRLRRSSDLISPLPANDPYFRNTPELNNAINTDVTVRSNITERYAYVSMYIVAVGYDNTQFTQIYSKPTHISVFKLPADTD